MMRRDKKDTHRNTLMQMKKSVFLQTGQYLKLLIFNMLFPYDNGLLLKGAQLFPIKSPLA